MRKNYRIVKQGAFNCRKVYYTLEASAINEFVNLKPLVPNHPDYSARLERRLDGRAWLTLGHIYQGELSWKQL